MCNKGDYYIEETVAAINIRFKSRMNQQMLDWREGESIFKSQRHFTFSLKNRNFNEPFFGVNRMMSQKEPQNLDYYKQYYKSKGFEKLNKRFWLTIKTI